MQPDFDKLLKDYQGGDAAALEQLVAYVYDELRRVARNQMKGASRELTLSPTGLVNEAYLSLRRQNKLPVSDRAHFFALAARAMRWVLMDRAKGRNAVGRGGGARPLSFDENFDLPAESTQSELAALDEALKGLQKQDERLARIVEMRFLVGLNVDETAEALGISPSTVKRDWLVAKIWLKRELNRGKD